MENGAGGGRRGEELSRGTRTREMRARLRGLCGAHVWATLPNRESAAHLVQERRTSCNIHAKPQAGPRFTGCEAPRSARKLSDAECAPLLREWPAESTPGAREERSRCSRSQRANMAAAFSSIIDRAGRRSPCGDSRRARGATTQNFAESSAKRKEGTPRVAGERVVVGPPSGDGAYIISTVSHVKNIYR